MRYPGWVLLLAITACDVEDPGDPTEPEDAQRYATAVCELAASCDCNPELLSDCEARSIRVFERLDDASGAKFDRGCFERITEFMGAEPPSCNFEGYIDDCMIFEGARASGASCELEGHPDTSPFAPTDCRDPGDHCVDGTCQQGLNILPEGAPCGLDVAKTCGQDLYCGLEGTCQPGRSFGESCDAPRACNKGGYGYCRGVATPGDTGVCTPYIAEGGACEPGEIESCGVGTGLICGPSGRCEPAVAACVFVPAYEDFYWRWIWERGAGN